MLQNDSVILRENIYVFKGEVKQRNISLGTEIFILPQNDKAFHDRGQRHILLSCQFSSFAICQQYRRGMGLEASDRFWLSRLTDNIHSLKHNLVSKHLGQL